MHCTFVNRYQEATKIVLDEFDQRVLCQDTSVEEADFVIGSSFLFAFLLYSFCLWRYRMRTNSFAC